MCGITGMLIRRPIDRTALAAMTAQLVHRGPDADGLWVDDRAGVGLGHRRLSIVDLSEAGAQPMMSDCERFIIVFNGEIYNHFLLRAELETAGPMSWKGHSDTETLLMCISKWGLSRALERAAGMFAFALWDRSKCVLTLVRDRMGEKPLYYGWAAGAFLFGSELKALTRFPGFDNPVNRRALDSLLRRSYVPSPWSIYTDVYKLAPGTSLTISVEQSHSPPADFDGNDASGQGLKLERYWSLVDVASEGAAAPVGSLTDAVDGLEERLVRAIADQSIADVPVGTFLSGGIDSSTIAALQQKHSGSKIQTFTIGFEDAAFDESGHARDVAKHLGTDHHEMTVTARDALDVIPELPQMYDEPFADSSQIPTHLLSKVARSKVKVALSGDGADELFGGYDRYVSLVRHHKFFERLPKAARKTGAECMRFLGSHLADGFASNRFYPKERFRLGVKFRKMAVLLAGQPSLAAFYTMRTSQWEQADEVVTGISRSDRLPDLPKLDGVGDAAHLMVWDALSYLPDDILCKVDRASMHTSLETRAPFLDPAVVAFAARIPVDMKLAPEGSKWVLRHLLYRYVPSSLVDRPKRGFSVPLAEWLRGPLRDWAEALLDPPALQRDDLFDVRLIRSRWHALLNGSYDYSAALWPVLMFQSWKQAQVRGATQ